MRVVVIGGYGNFGARVCRALSVSPAMEVVAAGRHPERGQGAFDGLSARRSQIAEIQIAIAPGQRAPRGEATVAAVLGYAGRRFKWRSGGAWRDAWGWQELKRLRFYGLGGRWAAACYVPDLELF